MSGTDQRTDAAERSAHVARGDVVNVIVTAPPPPALTPGPIRIPKGTVVTAEYLARLLNAGRKGNGE